MWPFKAKKHNLITISLTPQKIACGYITNNNSPESIIVNSYEETKFDSYEFEKAIVFNPTKITHIINNFTKKNNITNAQSALSVKGLNIQENIVTLVQSTPKKNNFNISELNNITWDYTYLGPSLKSGFDFYVCGIRKEILFQYKLLLIRSGLIPTIITTEKTAHLQLYKYIKGDSFRQSQLAVDLSKNNYNIQNTFTPENISNNFTLNQTTNINLKKNLPLLSTNIGLYLLGNINE